MSVPGRSICIFGCGNTLMGDDGVGVKVIEKLRTLDKQCLENVEIMDVGICNLNVLNKMNNKSKIIIIDSVVTGLKKGSIIRIDGNDLLTRNHEQTPILSLHEMSISDILLIAQYIQKLPEIIILGIEIGENDSKFSAKLSPEVLEAIDKIVPHIIREINTENAEQIKYP